MSLLAVSIEVHGKVQRVGYRIAARKEATGLALNGFVKNQADGSVYIEVSGETILVEQFISWCRRGPANAVVVELIINSIPPHQTGQFEIIQ